MPRPALLLSTEAAEAILAGALAATRAGSLGEYLRQRRQATRWFVRRHLQPVLGTAGDALLADTTHERATLLLLRWGMSRLRPDQAALDAPIDDAAWLERTSWRPFLALACHFGLVPVPRFDARYRRSAEESPAENLCGLWNVGPSTFYRYLDKARRMMVEALQAPAVRGEDRVALRDGVHAALAAVHAMTAILGISPLHWVGTATSDLLPVVDALVQVAMAQRTAARERKDYAAADAIRDQLSAAGIVVEDTPSGPRWTLKD